MKAFGLGGMTLSSVFKKPETRMYPVVVPQAPEVRRGTVSNHIEDCIFCGMCSRVCPSAAIEVDRKAKTWSINHFGCVQCAACVDACPKDCMNMTTDLPHVGAAIEVEVLQAVVEEESADAKGASPAGAAGAADADGASPAGRADADAADAGAADAAHSAAGAKVTEG